MTNSTKDIRELLGKIKTCAYCQGWCPHCIDEDNESTNESKLRDVISSLLTEIEKQWISVEENPLPDNGECLCQLEDGSYEVARCHPNITSVGGHFAFDRPPIVKWKHIFPPSSNQS